MTQGTDGMHVNHARLEQGAVDLHQTVKGIGDRLDRLETALRPLEQDWQGSAKLAYAQAKAKWDAAMQDMRTLLEETSRQVHDSNHEYRSADLRGARSFELG